MLVEHVRQAYDEAMPCLKRKVCTNFISESRPKFRIYIYDPH
jgi:hypothetical protein